MKNKIKYGAVVFFLFIAIGIISINLVQPNKEQQVKGNIQLLVNEDSYDYLVECANNFMKQNDKTTVTIKKMDDYNEVFDEMNENNKMSRINIAEIDRFNFEKLGLNYDDYCTDEEKLLEDYAKNFSEYRIAQVKFEDKAIGIPLTSRPIALYVREDMLKQYGYQRDSLNTWDDVIKIGEDIYTKSNGEVSIINATGQDYEDLLDLLTMESLNSGVSLDQAELDVQNLIKKLEDNNVLNLQDGGEFLARISSINAMKEIMAINEKCQWSVGDVPSIKPGTNKFFASEGENLLVINQNAENDKLIEKFITYVITNNEEAMKYVEKGQFFSSYLYTYNSKEIEEDVNNFVGKSPLVVLSNIEEKAPEIKDYDKYLKMKEVLRTKENNN